ncbi:hypothetical protein LNV08_01280 [Paucibacter sp. TC2R-5]|uniref:hypothetical protein n=1 Tax=Paucibacter sp. TC2R-5 TaxID=2893555 RepID=UPI0021E49F9D|nr:hypothetical protein [Paucibacter sp. TC2R-5]MCV2357601.1 hypothetical protein [Paucibacter sp. TC2R-5]
MKQLHGRDYWRELKPPNSARPRQIAPVFSKALFASPELPEFSVITEKWINFASRQKRSRFYLSQGKEFY